MRHTEDNEWYSKEKEVSFYGVAVGSKTIEVDGDEYTLLAIFPRSAGYKQEWAGNFTVGDGSILMISLQLLEDLMNIHMTEEVHSQDSFMRF